VCALYEFIAMLFCTPIIVRSIASSFVIRNSYAQAQLQQAPTVAYPWSNNLQISPGSTTQPLCPVGICSQSMNPASTNTITMQRKYLHYFYCYTIAQRQHRLKI